MLNFWVGFGLHWQAEANRSTLIGSLVPRITRLKWWIVSVFATLLPNMIIDHNLLGWAQSCVGHKPSPWPFFLVEDPLSESTYQWLAI